MQHPANRRVLIIDDTEAIHDDFRKILLEPQDAAFASLEAELFGKLSSNSCILPFEVTSAYQGQEGLEKVRAAVQAGIPYALAFVDVRMPPGWDGIETISQLWKADPDLEIVICTAHADYSWHEITHRLGNPDHLLILKKPFDVIEVLQLAHTLTEKWRLAQQSRSVLNKMEERVAQRTQQLRAANQELSQLAGERQVAARRLERVNRLYSVLSNINELIIRGGSAESLCRDACRVLVEIGLFRMVWFGVQGDQALVRPVASAGVDEGYLAELRISADPGSPYSAGPGGRALISNDVAVCNDIGNGTEFDLWREAAAKRGYASSAAFPVTTTTRVAGVLCLYSAEPNFFKDEEVALLKRLSADLSLAFQFLEQAAQLRLQSTALTAAENSIVITDRQGCILWQNPAFTQLTGFSSAETKGRKMSLLKSGQHPPEFYKQLWETITSGRPWHGQLTNRSKDGRCITVEGTITPVQDAYGGITHYIGIQRDIGARKRAEQRSQAFATLAKRLSVTNGCRDAARIIVDVAQELLGWDACTFDLYSPDDDLVHHVFSADLINDQRVECAPVHDHQPPTPMGRRAIQQGGLLLLRDNPQAMRPDGLAFGDTSKPSASIMFVPVRHGKNVTGILSIQSYTPNAYDQSSLDTLQALADHCGGALDRIKTQEKLRETQEQLRQSQKLEAIGQLAGGVAHDFNNLLAVIRGNSELVSMDPHRLGPEALDCLRQVIAASDRAAKLTQQLLIFGRKQVMQSRPVDLNEIVANLTKMLKRIIGEHINLQCDYFAKTLFVQADPGMLEQVLVNLVVNARDAMPIGGRLEVGTRQVQIDTAHGSYHQDARSGTFASLWVRDSGTGIDPDTLPRIFEPFFTTKDVGKGTGLGLATVYGIVKQHGGWVEVTSELNVGSIFTIFLPLLAGKVAAGDAPVAKAVLTGGSERILLVEDEDGVRGVARRVLERFGYRVSEAVSGSDALDKYSARTREFDLLLTDMVMPGGISGRTLAQKLRAQNPTLQVLFTSGYSGDTLGNPDFLSHMGAHFLPKPCSPEQLLRAVRECFAPANACSSRGNEAEGAE